MGSQFDVRRAIDREVELVEGAIRMVDQGGSPSVTVAGLRLGEAVLGLLAPTAAAAGVVLEPLWSADETGCDVRVRKAPV